MASSAGEDAAIGEAEAAAGAGKKNRRRRISDFLGDSEASPPPMPRLPRFTCARFRFVAFGRKRGGRKAVPVANKTGDASVDSSAAAGSKQPAETSTSSSASAEAAGMGLSMLLLLAARACVELNRMAEVRAQMEALLKEIRDEAGRMKLVVTPPARDFNLQLVSSSSCTSDTDTNRHHATTSPSAMEVAGQERECEPEPAEDDERAGVAAMGAAELEAEPAQHRPTLACNTEQEASDESSDDEFIELDDGGRFGGGDLRWGAGDEDSDEEEPSRAQHDGGVCAIELERALHELLHRRDRERVEELESALRRAEQRLMEKEMEARLWQDTATLALQPPRDGQ